MSTLKTFNIAVDKPSTGQYHVLDTECDRAYRVVLSLSGSVGRQLAPFIVVSSAELWQCGAGRFDRWHNAGAVVQYPGVGRLYVDVTGYTAGVLTVETTEEPSCGCRRLLLEHTQIVYAGVAVPVIKVPSAEYGLCSSAVVVTSPSSGPVTIPAWQPVPLIDASITAVITSGADSWFTSFTRMP